ncbi:hypothetical protein POM88_051660 [Heracleum sosnowskyi]|uniref:RNase H type-1 domain-containing protein n=1 Tax=Heracleum sosnowskyi TaxID=360622 RepID=A0AAD8H0X4_9APIA|nr:hypothetical protein POM88_051660 [Heracleum sosnowskyi]
MSLDSFGAMMRSQVYSKDQKVFQGDLPYYGISVFLTAWKVSSNRNLIWAKLVESVSGSEFHCINMYMPNSNSLRQEIKVVNWGPKPFKFFNVWLKNDKLQCRIKFRLSKEKEERVVNIQKIMKSIKEEARSWNKEENGDVYKNIDSLELLISNAEDKFEDEKKITMWKMELENQKLIRDQLLAQKTKDLEHVENKSGLSEGMKGIIDLSRNQAQRDLLHFGNYSWVVGNGRSIFFWEDRWSERGDIQSNSKSLKGILALVRGSNLKQAWEVVVSSTFWTLWLARNEYIFKGTKISLESSFLLVQLRSFQWCLTAELTKSELDTLWKVNPEGCILLRNKHKRRELFLGWNTSLVGYCDGSFKELENGTMMSGMGGILLNNKDETSFVFSGKCNSSSQVEAELEAIIFLANAAITHLNHTSKVIICTDCALAVQSLSKVKELWKYDMGLGAIADEFEEISEEDHLAEEIQDAEEMEEVQGDDEEGMQLVEGIKLDGMGIQG